MNVDCGSYYDQHREDFAGIPNADHAWYFYDKNFLKDVFLTLKGEIDRGVFPTRMTTSTGLELRV